MGSLSDTYELNVLDAVLGQGFTKDVTVYIALFTSAPTDSALGTEIVGNAYARVAVTNNATNWTNATSVGGVGTKTNGTAFTFPQASGSWGTVTHWAAMNHVSASAASNMVTHGALTSPRLVSASDIPQFGPGTLVVTAD